MAVTRPTVTPEARTAARPLRPPILLNGAVTV